MPGEMYTQEEKETWMSKAVEFMAMPNDAAPCTRKNKKAIGAAAPRTSTLIVLRGTENALVVSTGSGYEAFDNKSTLEKWKFWEHGVGDGAKSAKGKVAAIGAYEDVDELRRALPPRSLVFVGDQDGNQWDAFNFIKYSLLLNFESVRDPYHRSGYYPDYYHSTMVMDNKYGPWAHADWYRHLQDEAVDAALRLGPDGPVLLLFWGRILQDKELRDPSFLGGLQDGEARKAFLDHLASSKLVNAKGVSVAPSKWFSWMMAHAEWDELTHTRAFLQTRLGPFRRWSSRTPPHHRHPDHRRPCRRCKHRRRRR